MKHCPFCGEDEDIVIVEDHTNALAWVSCETCKAKGPKIGGSDAFDLAETMWDHRAFPEDKIHAACFLDANTSVSGPHPLTDSENNQSANG